MFNTNKNASSISRWVILGILGIFLIFFRRFALNIVYAVVAVGLMLVGVASVYVWWEDHRAGMNDLLSLAGGLAIFAVGLWILRNPGSFDRILNMIIGVVLIVAGVNWLNRSRASGSRLMTVLSAVAIVAGILIAFSRSATGWIATACGLSLIYTAVIGFIGEKAFRG